MAFSVKKIPGSAFLAFDEKKDFLISELKNRFSLSLAGAEYYGNIIYIPDYDCSDGAVEKIPYFASTALLEPAVVYFDSIGDAVSALKEIQRSWAGYSFTCYRRTSLIQEKLPYVNLKKRDFPFEIPKGEIGFFCLLDEHTMLISASTTSNLPCGKIVFNEDHENPPSRAYLKIQESLLLARHFFAIDLPGSDTRVFEAGACPGGWTYVLASLGAEVFAVDRAPLADSLMQNPKVKFLAHDAFTLMPQDLGDFDFVLSDVICYPERLLEWIKMWLSSGRTKKMICTIKMQGEIDWDLIAQFAAIPHSRVVHLNYNKHELTFIHAE